MNLGRRRLARTDMLKDRGETLASLRSNVYTGIFPGLNLGERMNAPKR